uniref:BTB domain-containing protein n=1 Tax=Panagrolaimus sp. PS1159 TaxID=55785 RepID=A0AC35EUC9_9BILA
MSCSKLSTTEIIPISVRMKIPKERLLAENQKEEWQIKSEDYSIHGLPGFSYYVGLCSEMFEDNGRCLFVIIGSKKKSAFKKDISFKITFVGSNDVYIYDSEIEFQDAYDHIYIPCGGTDELFDPTTKCLVFVVEAILPVQKEDSELAGLNSEISKNIFGCKLGMQLWDRDDEKNLAFIVDGKEIKVHRIVVESKSPEWKEMIETGLKGSSEDGKIAILYFNFKTVETALKFCYGIEEKHLWSVESANEVLKFADDCDLNDLKKISVADLDYMNIDFAFELMKSLFSQSPNLNKIEMISQMDEQVQNQRPQIIQKLFVTNVTVIAAFMLIASFLIGEFLGDDVDSFFQNIIQIWRRHIFCGIQ